MVANVARLQVNLADDVDANAELIGQDPHTELAVLKVSIPGALCRNQDLSVTVTPLELAAR